VPGEPTFSATPLAWTHAGFIRLARAIDAGRPLDTPQVVACRYQTTLCR
jgi:glucoamylase